MCFWKPRRSSSRTRCSNAVTGIQPDSRRRETICAVGTNEYLSLTPGNGEPANTDGASERNLSSDRPARVWMNDGLSLRIVGIILGLSFIMFSFVAQRKHGAREILEAGPLAKAESSRRNGSGECCLSRPVVSLNFPTSPYNGLPTSRAEH